MMRQILYFFMGVLTAMVGHSLHGSAWWSFINGAFWPLSVIKWFICQEVTLKMIEKALDIEWFFQ